MRGEGKVRRVSYLVGWMIKLEELLLTLWEDRRECTCASREGEGRGDH